MIHTIMIVFVYHHPWYSGTENVANLMYIRFQALWYSMNHNIYIYELLITIYVPWYGSWYMYIYICYSSTS